MSKSKEQKLVDALVMHIDAALNLNSKINSNPDHPCNLALGCRQASNMALDVAAVLRHHLGTFDVVRLFDLVGSHYYDRAVKEAS